jgi:hypothetical protein
MKWVLGFFVGEREESPGLPITYKTDRLTDCFRNLRKEQNIVKLCSSPCIFNEFTCISWMDLCVLLHHSK